MCITSMIAFDPAMSFRYSDEWFLIAESGDHVALESHHTFDDLLVGILGRYQRNDVAPFDRITVNGPARQEHIVRGFASVGIQGWLH